MALLVSVAAHLAHALWRPFVRRRAYLLQHASLGVTTFVYTAGLLLKVNTFGGEADPTAGAGGASTTAGDGEDTVAVIGVGLVVLCSGVIVAGVLMALQEIIAHVIRERRIKAPGSMARAAVQRLTQFSSAQHRRRGQNATSAVAVGRRRSGKGGSTGGDCGGDGDGDGAARGSTLVERRWLAGLEFAAARPAKSSHSGDSHARAAPAGTAGVAITTPPSRRPGKHTQRTSKRSKMGSSSSSSSKRANSGPGSRQRGLPVASARSHSAAKSTTPGVGDGPASEPSESESPLDAATPLAPTSVPPLQRDARVLGLAPLMVVGRARSDSQKRRDQTAAKLRRLKRKKSARARTSARRGSHEKGSTCSPVGDRSRAQRSGSSPKVVTPDGRVFDARLVHESRRRTDSQEKRDAAAARLRRLRRATAPAAKPGTSAQGVRVQVTLGARENADGSGRTGAFEGAGEGAGAGAGAGVGARAGARAGAGTRSHGATGTSNPLATRRNQQSVAARDRGHGGSASSVSGMESDGSDFSVNNPILKRRG